MHCGCSPVVIHVVARLHNHGTTDARLLHGLQQQLQPDEVMRQASLHMKKPPAGLQAAYDSRPCRAVGLCRGQAGPLTACHAMGPTSK